MTRTEQLADLNAAIWQQGEERCQDAADLLRFGEHPERVADRLHTTVGALARLLRRHGYATDARVFERAARRRAA